MHRLYDTHCHVDALGAPGAELTEAAEAGVAAIVLPAVEPANWAACCALASAHPDTIRLALGIHPQVVAALEDETLDAALDALPAQLSAHGAVAVGEIGLDHRVDRTPQARARQLRVFERQLDVALETGLVPLIHVLGAHDTFLHAWRRHPICGRVPGVLHSYSGSAELVATYVRAGLYLAFSGAVSWSNARRVPRACQAVPAERLLIETDAPYQPPHPLEGRPNRPARLTTVAEAVARLRGEPLAVIAEQTWANAAQLFG